MLIAWIKNYKNKQNEGKSFNQETQRRMQDREKKRSLICYQQKKSSLQAKARLIVIQFKKN
jgi:hypothetical protein